MSPNGTAKRPPRTSPSAPSGASTTPPATPATPATTTTEGFTPVNTKLEALSEMNVRTMGALPEATGGQRKIAGSNEVLFDEMAMGSPN
jgi:hypothetical protein